MVPAVKRRRLPSFSAESIAEQIAIAESAGDEEQMIERHVKAVTIAARLPIHPQNAFNTVDDRAVILIEDAITLQHHRTIIRRQLQAKFALERVKFLSDGGFSKRNLAARAGGELGNEC